MSTAFVPLIDGVNVSFFSQNVTYGTTWTRHDGSSWAPFPIGTNNEISLTPSKDGKCLWWRQDATLEDVNGTAWSLRIAVDPHRRDWHVIMIDFNRNFLQSQLATLRSRCVDGIRTMHTSYLASLTSWSNLCTTHSLVQSDIEWSFPGPVSDDDEASLLTAQMVFCLAGAEEPEWKGGVQWADMSQNVPWQSPEPTALFPPSPPPPPSLPSPPSPPPPPILSNHRGVRGAGPSLQQQYP